MGGSVNLGQAATGAVTGGLSPLGGPVGTAVGAVYGAAPNSGIGKAIGSTLGPLVGASGGAQGTGYAKPTAIPIQQGTNAQEISNAYTDSRNNLYAQQKLLQALQQQKGLQNQSNILGYQGQQAAGLSRLNGAQNLGSAYGQTQGLANQLEGYAPQTGGALNQTGAVTGLQNLAAQQQGTAGQYQNLANGVGYNPAQAMLNQQTGQNIANQAALMAGQRGASANAGLLARQAAQQGAATQQQAVGQGATMQAQQSLQGLSGLANQQQAIGQTQQNIAGISAQQIGQQQAQQAALAQQAAQQVGLEQAALGQEAGQANQIAGQQIAGTTTASQAAQNEQQMVQNALASQNQQAVSQQNAINAANAGLAQTNIQGQQKLAGGILNAAGSAAGLAAGAKGGEVHHMADGGEAETQPAAQAPMSMESQIVQGPQSSFGKFLGNFATNAILPEAGTKVQMPAAAKGGMAKTGGKVIAHDEKQKAVKAKNSYSNDRIPAMLSEGEIVIPRSVSMGKDPVRGAADFVAKVMAKRGRR